MNYKLRTDPMIKLFNQSNGRLRPTKIKSLTLASSSGRWSRCFRPPCSAARSSPLDRGGLPADTFSILLSGPYKQVAKGHGPDLGLTTVDLSDGSFSTTKIFRVSGLPEENNGHGKGETKKAIGNFYVQFNGSLVGLRPPRGGHSDGFHGAQSYTCSRRAGWDVLCRNR